MKDESARSGTKAVVIGAAVAFVPTVVYLLTRTVAHWGSTLVIGAGFALAAGIVYGVFSGFSSALVARRTLLRRIRVAASDVPPGVRIEPLDVDPLEQDERDLEERFRALERGHRG